MSLGRGEMSLGREEVSPGREERATGREVFSLARGECATGRAEMRLREPSPVKRKKALRYLPSGPFYRGRCFPVFRLP